jgi:integrase
MRVPKYRRHSSRDRGFVEWKGKRHLLPGSFNSRQSRDAYDEFLKNSCGIIRPKPAIPVAEGLIVARLISTYLEVLFEQENGDKRGVWGVYKYALRPFAKEHGHEPAATFGPLALKKWQAKLAEKELSRGYIDVCISCIKQTFRWAVSEELIPPSVWHGLQSVRSLKSGKSKAKESVKRQPVPWAWVEPVLEECSPAIRAMILIQWFTGARSMSVCHAKPSQFTQDGEFLLWRPKHKTEAKVGEIVLPIGPRAQAVLAPFLADDTERYLFSPREMNPNRRYGERYTSLSYMQAIRCAIKRLNRKLAKTNTPPLPHWSPHRLRHSKGHAVRAEFGLEAAQAVLAHEQIATTEIYSAKRLDLAKEVARRTG